MSSKNRRVKRAFDREALALICELPEVEFADMYGMETVTVAQRAPSDIYHYKDNGSNVLFVAHLDTVVTPKERTCRFYDTPHAGPVVHSGALDDRLGAYIGLELLPALGITYDWLLTTGEEQGMSTAKFFDADKHDYIIEFDRGGTDVVMYDYEDDETYKAVRNAGAQVGQGSYSDISYMEHLGIKGFNWGVGYRDYHSTRGHAYLLDTYAMVAKYLTFHEQNEGVYMPHVPTPSRWPAKDESRWGDTMWTEEDIDAWIAEDDEHAATLKGWSTATTLWVEQQRKNDEQHAAKKLELWPAAKRGLQLPGRSPERA